jgi:aryl-alcohol dehydrogenase-like predicted oxidoreductase
MEDLKAMHTEGKYVGLSECTPLELREAHAVFPIPCVQMEWSLTERGIERALMADCKELGISVPCGAASCTSRKNHQPPPSSHAVSNLKQTNERAPSLHP